MGLESDKGLIIVHTYLICVRQKPWVQSFRKHNHALRTYLFISPDGVGALCISSVVIFERDALGKTKKNEADNGVTVGTYGH